MSTSQISARAADKTTYLSESIWGDANKINRLRLATRSAWALIVWWRNYHAKDKAMHPIRHLEIQRQPTRYLGSFPCESHADKTQLPYRKDSQRLGTTADCRHSRGASREEMTLGGMSVLVLVSCQKSSCETPLIRYRTANRVKISNVNLEQGAYTLGRVFLKVHRIFRCARIIWGRTSGPCCVNFAQDRRH